MGISSYTAPVCSTRQIEKGMAAVSNELGEYLKVGDKVYINGLPKKGRKKIMWIVKSVDDRGNARMISSNNSNIVRNYPNVNVLAGWLTREDGIPIIGRAFKVEPLPPRNSKGPSPYYSSTFRRSK